MPLPDFALDSDGSPAISGGFLAGGSPSFGGGILPDNEINPGLDGAISHSNGDLPPGSLPGFDLDLTNGSVNRGQPDFPGVQLDSDFVPIPHIDPAVHNHELPQENIRSVTILGENIAPRNCQVLCLNVL